jgi:predicted AAA+ superfamily ATPase
METYIERDVRQMRNVTDLAQFTRFVKLCAGRAGQILNITSIANDADITVNTAKAWLSILEASYIIFFLQPFHQNFNKRLIKSPKMYFFDTGLLCYLLGIGSVEQLNIHHAYGNIMENMLLSELFKWQTHRGLRPSFSYWRDSSGNEIDLLIEENGKLTAIELKASKTFNTRLFDGLAWWQKTSGHPVADSMVIFLGDQSYQTGHGQLMPWQIALLSGWQR